MSELNQDRTRRGNAAKKSLKYILDLSKDLNYITEIAINYREGKPGYADRNQFKAPYLIVFEDGTEWILFTTTSIRERIKEQYWDALNLKMINTAITKAYLVYPDSISDAEKRTAVAKNRKIQEGGEYSTLEGIVSQDRVFKLIEEYALRDKTPSQIRDIEGKNFEKRIAAILNNPWNLEKWKNNDATLEGMHFDVFLSIINCFGVDPANVAEISATANKDVIGTLPSGGSPKTDVLASITDVFGDETQYTISCKRTSAVAVSVHQYSADTFADVLDRDNVQLRTMLNVFQEHGAIKSRDGTRYMTEQQEAELTNELTPLVYKLCEWAIGGKYGDGDPKTQWANYIVTYDNNTSSTSVHTVADYCDLLMASDLRGSFGTPFGWTYQGTRGSNIQLKSKIIK